jgi:hypothetical protein
MKDIIWLSPSLAAGAIAARLVDFFERRRQIRSRRDVELTAPSLEALQACERLTHGQDVMRVKKSGNQTRSTTLAKPSHW